MKVILTANIKNVGEKGDVKEVKPGYARNFLLPKNLAVVADSVVGQEMITKKESEVDKGQEAIEEIAKIVANNQNLKIEFQRKASSEGKLFGSVTTKEIKSELEKKLGVKIESMIPDTSVKDVGEHKYNLSLPGQQTLDITVSVITLDVVKK